MDRPARLTIAVGLFLLGCLSCYADGLIVGDLHYEGVLITETSSRYYVRIPSNGTVVSLSKDKVQPGSVAFTQDSEERAALLSKWQEAKKKTEEERGSLATTGSEPPDSTSDPRCSDAKEPRDEQSSAAQTSRAGDDSPSDAPDAGLPSHFVYRQPGISRVPPEVMRRICAYAEKTFPGDYALQGRQMHGDVTSYLALQNYIAPAVPSEVMQRIRASAKKVFPDEYTAQKTLVDNDVRDYLARKGKPSVDAVIRRQAELEWPNAFEMQEYVRDQQLRAHHNLSLGAPEGIPQDVFTAMRRNAELECPRDFEMQEYVVKEQCKAYYNLSSGPPEGIPQGVFTAMRRNAELECPRDFEMQEYVVKEQCKAYYNLSSGPPEGIPQGLFTAMRRKAENDWPDDFEMQEDIVKERCRAYLRQQAQNWLWLQEK